MSTPSPADIPPAIPKVPVTHPSLTELDRCDRCGSRAYARAVFIRPETADLLFCGHHWRVNEKTVSAIADEVIDETHRLRVHADLTPVG